MANVPPTRQRYGLATGAGLDAPPGGPVTRWNKGGHVKTKSSGCGGVGGMPSPKGFSKGGRGR